MSIEIVSKKHIDVLVYVAFCRWGASSVHPVLSQNLTEHSFGQQLIDKNYRSYNARYESNDTSGCEYVYVNPSEYVAIKAVEVLKLLDYYQYQCSESEDYCSMIDDILKHMKSEAIQHLPGYDDFPWGLDN